MKVNLNQAEDAIIDLFGRNPLKEASAFFNIILLDDHKRIVSNSKIQNKN